MSESDDTTPAASMNKLDELRELQDKLTLINLQLTEQLEIAMEPIKDELNAISAKFGSSIAAVDAEIELLIAEIKADVLAHGATLKATDGYLQAQWVRGRVSWDHKRLDGYAIANPDVLAFRSEGEPSVRLATVGK